MMMMKKKEINLHRRQQRQRSTIKMIQRMHLKSIIPSLTVLVLILSSTLVASSTNTQYRYIINRSYKHNLSKNEITQAIRRQIHQSFLQKKDIDIILDKEVELPDMNIDIDVSCSLVKDDGIETILDSLQSCDEGEEPASISVSLEARMNRISSLGLATFFDRLVTSAEERLLELNVTSTSASDEEGEGITELSIDENENGESIGNHDDEIKTNETEIVVAPSGPLENNQTIAKATETTIPEKRHNYVYMESIDLGLNGIGLNGAETYKKKSSKKSFALFLHSMRKLIENQCGLACPSVLRMDNCGLGPPSCRSIGKGIINSAENILNRDKTKSLFSSNFASNRRLKELYLSGNPIGESGTTALAAALKIASRIEDEDTDQENTSTHHHPYLTVIDTLDISSCGVGDIGANALALAMTGNPGCVKCLNLSNNCISDRGAIALAKALKRSCQKLNGCCSIDTLDLSNNIDIGNEGATALFDAVECGAIRNLLLRSCSIRADGLSSLGEVLASIISKSKHEDSSTSLREHLIDISGNKFGTRAVKKKPGVSASMMNSVNSIGQKGFGFLKSGLKDIVDFGGSSLESDDEAEEEDDSIKPEDNQVSGKCGAALLYDSFMESSAGETKDHKDGHRNAVNITLGLRMCNFDETALDALAAMIVYLKSECGDSTSIKFDCDMNQGIDEDDIQALKQSKIYNDLLVEMSERHHEVLESRRRLIEAQEAESRLNGFFGDDYDSDNSDFFFGNDQVGGDNYDPYDDYDY